MLAVAQVAIDRQRIRFGCSNREPNRTYRKPRHNGCTNHANTAPAASAIPAPSNHTAAATISEALTTVRQIADSTPYVATSHVRPSGQVGKELRTPSNQRFVP